MHAILVGDGAVTARLADRLLAIHEFVYLVVQDAHEAEDLALRFPTAMVVHGHGGEAACLRAAGATDADVVYALSADDAVNIATCLLARTMFGIEHQVALSHHEGSDEAYRALGITCLCEPEIVAARLQELGHGAIIS
jgi:trk system potassium uptake protein TrkA